VYSTIRVTGMMAYVYVRCVQLFWPCNISMCLVTSYGKDAVVKSSKKQGVRRVRRSILREKKEGSLHHSTE